MSKTRMKKYMIRCDIEGVSRVVSYEQAELMRFGFMMSIIMDGTLI